MIVLKTISCEFPNPILSFSDKLMPIPPLQYDGFLPPGLHLAEVDEIEDHFGKSTSRRKDLFVHLRLFVEVARYCGALRMFVNGSFVTAKAEPEDVDVVIWISGKYYELIGQEDKEAMRLEEMFVRREPKEAFLVDKAEEWNGWIEFFSRVRGHLGKRKGLAEVKLT
jgi:hypothetical protein